VWRGADGGIVPFLLAKAFGTPGSFAGYFVDDRGYLWGEISPVNAQFGNVLNDGSPLYFESNDCSGTEYFVPNYMARFVFRRAPDPAYRAVPDSPSFANRTIASIRQPNGTCSAFGPVTLRVFPFSETAPSPPLAPPADPPFAAPLHPELVP
jgi:hypothetical protein